MDVGHGLCSGMATLGSPKGTFHTVSHFVAKLSGGAGMINEGLSHPSQCIAVWQIHTQREGGGGIERKEKTEGKMRRGGGGEKEKEKGGHGLKWNKNVCHVKLGGQMD